MIIFSHLFPPLKDPTMALRMRKREERISLGGNKGGKKESLENIIDMYLR